MKPDVLLPDEECPSTSHPSELRSNIFWLYGLQGLTYLIPAALLPYLVRVLGLEQYGLMAFAQAIAQYFVVGTDYGFNYSTTRAIAQHRNDKHEVSRIFWTTLMVKAGLVVLGFVVIAVLIRFLPRLHQNAGVYYAAYLTVVGGALFPGWLFQGLEQMRSITLITSVAKVVPALFVILLVHGPSDTMLATLLMSSGMLIAGVVGIAAALRRHILPFSMPAKSSFIEAIFEGRHLFLTTAAVSLYSNTNTFLVGLISGNVQAGYFSLADKLIRVITGLISPFIQAAYPYTVRLVAQSRDLGLAFLRKTLRRGAALGISLGLLMFASSKLIADIAFSKEAASVRPLLQVLSLFPLFGCLNFIYGTLVLMPLGFDREQSKFLMAVGVLNIVLGCILIPHLGALGAVITMSSIEVVQTIGSSSLVRRGGVRFFKQPQTL